MSTNPHVNKFPKVYHISLTSTTTNQTQITPQKTPQFHLYQSILQPHFSPELSSHYIQTHPSRNWQTSQQYPQTQCVGPAYLRAAIQNRSSAVHRFADATAKRKRSAALSTLYALRILPYSDDTTAVHCRAALRVPTLQSHSQI